MQTIREIATFVLGLLVWAVFIIGPFTLLLADMPRMAIVASAGSMVAFAVSVRWRTGFVLLPGCLGITLMMYNIATFCVAAATITGAAGASLPVRIAVGIAGIPIAVLLMWGVNRIENYILGPAVTKPRNSRKNASEDG